MSNKTKNDYVLKHDFNYGTGTDDKDSVINKLELRNKQDLCDYIQNVILETFVNVKVNNNIVSNIIDESDTKIVIKLI